MSQPGPLLVGRESELARLQLFLESRGSRAAGLVIEGPAGAGKTTLWRAGVDRAEASGYRVIRCRPAGAEVQLAYAGLTDLLEPQLADVLAGLPAPQRRALEVALLLEDAADRQPDRRTIAAAVLSALRALARDRPLLLAVDDAQWLDTPSAEAVEFALRRLADDDLAVLAARRTGSATGGEPAPLGGLRPERVLDPPPERLAVGPLSLGATHRMLAGRSTESFNRRTLERIHATSGGNPFYAIELLRALEAGTDGHVGGAAVDGAVNPLPLGSSLGELLTGRMQHLDEAARDALFIAAALPEPTLDLIGAALGTGSGSALASLEPAVREGIVRIGAGAVEFVHPLLAAACYAALEPARQRAWHGRIADAATDPELRARHRARSNPGLDEGVAHELLAAARSAAARGAPGSAAELYLEAIDRLPLVEPDATRERAGWVLEATSVLASIGARDQARVLLEPAVPDLARGSQRSAGLVLLADLIEGEPGGGERALALLDEAIVEAGSDPRARARALLDREQFERGGVGLAEALVFARQALEAAEASGDEQLLAAAHVRTADLETVLGLSADAVARFRTALDLAERFRVDASNSAASMLAVCLIRAGRLDEARPYLAGERARAAAEGDEVSFSHLSLFLAELEWLAGNWDAAEAIAREGVDVAEVAGNRSAQVMCLVPVVLVRAARGEPEAARALALRAVHTAEEIGEIGYGDYARQALAFVEHSLGRSAAVIDQLGTFRIGRGVEGPKRIAFIGDAIEALVRLGDIDQAAALTAEITERGGILHRPPLSAMAGRCRALVLAARGDLEAAIRDATAAVAAFEVLDQPFEAARSRLVLGEVQRRAKHRRAARDSLTAAVEAFDLLGAALWSRRAAEERARIGGRVSIEGLSPTELRVAALVAQGRSNKEVAAELFVSVRAVEANLSKIYAKLGIESRTELARRF